MSRPAQNIDAQYKEIRDALKRYEGCASIQEISAATLWSPSKVRAVVRRLISDGRLAEYGVTSTGAVTYGTPKVDGSPATAREAIAVLDEMQSGLTAQIAAFRENLARAEQALGELALIRRNLTGTGLPYAHPDKRTEESCIRWVDWHRDAAALPPVMPVI